MMQMQRRQTGRMRGTVYLTMLFGVAFLGVALAAGGSLWATERQREKEAELLAIGDEFSAAIESYYLSSPGLVKTYPARLDDLLHDNRFLFVKRHLRQVYVDPMTGTRNWHLVRSQIGGIEAITSTSDKRPIKTGNFVDRFAGLSRAQRYSDWAFGFTPP